MRRTIHAATARARAHGRRHQPHGCRPASRAMPLLRARRTTGGAAAAVPTGPAGLRRARATWHSSLLEGRTNEPHGDVRHPGLIETASIRKPRMCGSRTFQFAPAGEQPLILSGTIRRIEPRRDHMTNRGAHRLDARAIAIECGDRVGEPADVAGPGPES